MNKYLIFSAMFMMTTLAEACINTYVVNFETDKPSKEYIAEQKSELKNQKISIETLNDLGVLQIYEGEFTKAIATFKKIESIKPKLAKTAANLGTAYELNGNLEQAKYWIRQGMQRDPNIHEGSEWIHLKILEAKTQQKANKDWIYQNDVLGLDFGEKDMPYAYKKSVIFDSNTYDLDAVLEHSILQITQRLSFIEYMQKDLISAQIVMNIANIEMINYNDDVRTMESLFDVAQRLGYSNQALLKKREEYYFHSKWYSFKRFFAEIKTKVLDLMRG